MLKRRGTLLNTAGINRITQISKRRGAKPKCPPQRTQRNELGLRMKQTIPGEFNLLPVMRDLFSCTVHQVRQDSLKCVIPKYFL